MARLTSGIKPAAPDTGYGYIEIGAALAGLADVHTVTRFVSGERFQTKRIIVKPGEQLSLQMHYHTSEHWIVVSGTAVVTVDGREQIVSENQSVYIAAGSQHRLANLGKLPLHLTEVQCGPNLGEDDIVRFEDNYARA